MKEIDKKFKPLTIEELIHILNLSIKKDDINKLITFLTLLSAYTTDSQINISFVAPSASGKSFIALELSLLFPLEDLIKLGSCSPNAFYHEQGTYDKNRNAIIVNLERKIIIFLDQPGTQLLARLRALLSHDEKEIHAKITDKNQRGGNRTKTVIIRGFPAVIFCTAGLNIDEQEATRFLLLSPEITQEKLSETIYERIRKAANTSFYQEWLESDERRMELKERIKAIRDSNINEIRIDYAKLIDQMFRERVKVFKPRHQRDIARITNLVKILALLNLWYRKNEDGIIYANKEDIENAFRVWDVLSESQELNLPPYIFNLYKEVIVPAYQEKNTNSLGENKLGLTRQDIINKHFEVYGRHLQDWVLRQQILPMLETSGLISQDPDSSDRRKLLIVPLSLNQKNTTQRVEKNSEWH